MRARQQPPLRYDPTAPRLRPFPGGRSLDHANPYIYLGSIKGVRKARARRGSLVCPLDMDPLAFQWPVVGLQVLVVTDADKTPMAVRLAQALIRDGARLVVCVADDGWTSHHHEHCKQEIE